MLDIKFIREHTDEVRAALRKKHIDTDLDRLLARDEARRNVTRQVEELRRILNLKAKEIGQLPPTERGRAGAEVKAMKAELTTLEESLKPIEQELDDLLLRVPSIPAPEVPDGQSDADNLELRRVGTPRSFDFEPRDHVALGEGLGILDVARGVKIAGTRNFVLRGDGMLLEQAVLRFVLERLSNKGYEPIMAPVLVRESAMVGTGFFPFGREDTYQVPEDELFLVGTSEVSLVSLHADETLEEDDLPRRLVGYSTCFRREAGTHGRDTHGVYRVHQFQKVEQVVIGPADPARSLELHHELLQNAEEIVQALGLPYRVALACGAEIGLGQVRKHEIETWMPSRGAYCETHSCSTLHDFQARRLRIRYRTKAGELRYCHTLNNTAIASPRILIPLLEHYQNADGSVTVPEVLRPYMGGRERLRPCGGRR